MIEEVPDLCGMIGCATMSRLKCVDLRWYLDHDLWRAKSDGLEYRVWENESPLD